MIWLSISRRASVLDPIAAPSRPWARLHQFWQFCQFYGDYQVTPPRQRRQFILNLDRQG